jgi:hypothetical protein
VRKAQFVAGAIGLLATVGPALMVQLSIWPTTSSLYSFWALEASPTIGLAVFLGVKLNSELLFVAVVVLINTFLCVLVGSAVGWVIRATLWTDDHAA